MRKLPAVPAALSFWLLVSLIALAAAGKAILYDTLDPDCFWHLRVAGELHRQGIGPIVDDLSYASIRRPWTPYSWLAELGMKSVWDAGGYRAAVATQAMLQAAIVFLLAACCLSVQKTVWGSPTYLAAAVAVFAGTFLMLPYLSFRPVTAAFVLLLLVTWLVQRDVEKQFRSRAVWLILPLTVLLTNVHLFSMLVPGALLLLGIGLTIRQSPAAKRVGLLATLATLACLMTPMLAGMIRTANFYATKDTMVAGPVIAEMQSFARGPMGWVSAGIVVFTIASILKNHRRLSIGSMLIAAAAAALMLKLGRFAPIFAIAGIPLLAASMPRLSDRLLTRTVMAVALLCLAIIGIGRLATSFPDADVSLSQWLNRHGPDLPGYPCVAADFVADKIENSTGKIINEFNWGGYLAWRLDGRYQVLLDGRTQVFPADLWQATYLGSEQETARKLSTIEADAAVVPVKASRFHDTLIRLGWTEIYRDDRAEVLRPPGAIAGLTPE